MRQVECEDGRKMYPGLMGKSEMIVREKDLVSRLGGVAVRCPFDSSADSTPGGSGDRSDSGVSPA